MPAAWQVPVAWFVLFNLPAATFIARAVRFFTQSLNVKQACAGAVVLWLVAAVGIKEIRLQAMATHTGGTSQGWELATIRPHLNR